MLTRIAPELPASNLRESIDYYQGKLGFHLAAEVPPGEYAVLERDDVAIHLFQAHSDRLAPMAVHIFTDDLDSLYRELRGRGAQVTQDIVQKPWGNRDFRVHDQSGNEIKFTEPAGD